MTVHIAMLFAALLAGLLYGLAHKANLWVFNFFEFSSHISLVYIPAFLRLANVLVLNWFWGAGGTMLGGVFLIVVNQELFIEAFPNVLISSLGGSVALGMFHLSNHRAPNIYRIADWFQLTLFCALANTTLHHVYWSGFERQQLQAPIQIAWMIGGDIIGTMIGALVFRSIVSKFDLPTLGNDMKNE